jgi:hypothetical protein
MVPTHVQLPRAKGRVKVRQRRDPATGTPPVGSARGMRCAAGRFICRRNPPAGLVTLRVSPWSRLTPHLFNNDGHFYAECFPGKVLGKQQGSKCPTPASRAHAQAPGAFSFGLSAGEDLAVSFSRLAPHAALPVQLLRLLVALDPGAGLVALRQRFVRRCQNCGHGLALAKLADKIARIVKAPTSASGSRSARGVRASPSRSQNGAVGVAVRHSEMHIIAPHVALYAPALA